MEEAERGRAFYAGLFGLNSAPGPSGVGFVITTPGLPGGIHGGDPGAAPYRFFAVDDLEAAMARVRELGGDVEDMDVDGGEAPAKHGGTHGGGHSGRFKLRRDEQGSPFGPHQRPGPH